MSCARGFVRCEGIYRRTPAEKCDRRTVLPRRRSRFVLSKLGAILRWVRVAVGVALLSVQRLQATSKNPKLLGSISAPVVVT